MSGVRRSIGLLFSGLLLCAAPASAGARRFFEFSSDFLQALHLCYWAADLQVSGRRPLMALALSLDEQREKLNQAREILLRHEGQPAPDGRRAVGGLMNGIELFSLIATEDMSDFSDMNTRAELTQKLEDRQEQREQAVAVMAASVPYMTDALSGQPGLLTVEEAASLWKQATLFFGEDLAVGGDRASPILGEVEKLRRALRHLADQKPDKKASKNADKKASKSP